MSSHFFLSSVLAVAIVTTLGCGSTTQPVKPDSQPSPAADKDAKESAHVHGDGPHGGTVIDWGGKYHVEFTVDHDKKEAVVYILGGDEKTPAPIKTEKITVTIDDPLSEFEAVSQPLEGEGEADGLSSRFVGTHDTLGIVKEYSGTISGVVDGIPYSQEFEEHAD